MRGNAHVPGSDTLGRHNAADKVIGARHRTGCDFHRDRYLIGVRKFGGKLVIQNICLLTDTNAAAIKWMMRASIESLTRV